MKKPVIKHVVEKAVESITKAAERVFGPQRQGPVDEFYSNAPFVARVNAAAEAERRARQGGWITPRPDWLRPRR
jgi:hypothetical protein